MHKYVRKNKEIINNLKRIRLIKEDLAKVSNLVERDIVLIHGNIILENHYTISHYNIPVGESIWFGLISEYMDEFGSHVVIAFKQEDLKQSIDVCEKLLIKKDEPISKVRSLMSRLYSWIGKVPLWNKMNQELLDDQTVENCGLVDYPIIFLRSARIVMAIGKKLEQTDFVAGTEKLEEGVINMGNPLDSILHILEPILEPIKDNLPKLIPIINKSPQIDLSDTGYESHSEFVSNGVEILTHLDDYVKHNVSSDELNSHLMDCRKYLPTAQIGTWGQYKELFQKFMMQSKEVLMENNLTAFGPCFDFILSACISLSDNLNIDPDTIVGDLAQLKLSNRCIDLYNSQKQKAEFSSSSNMENLSENENSQSTDESMTNKSIEDEEKSNLEEKESLVAIENFKKLKLSHLLPRFNEFMSTVNKNCNVHQQDLKIQSTVDKDVPFEISSLFPLPAHKVKEIISNNEESKTIHLATREFDHFYGDSDIIPTGNEIPYINVSEIDMDDFEVVDCLGDGAYGEVSIFRNNQTGRECVLKQIPFNDNNREKLEEIREVIREIITFSRVAQHSRIIQYFHYYQGEYCFFIEMEYMKGGSLKSHIEKNKPLSEISIWRFSCQILEGLKYLHEKSIVHADIKSDNILLDEDNNVKLSDFGLAKCFNKSYDDCQQVSNQSGCGTELYMAPEMKLGNKYGQPIDIWAFGITVIEMVNGEISSEDIRILVEKTNAEISNRIPESIYLSEFIDYCIRQNPEERLTSSQLLESRFIKQFCK